MDGGRILIEYLNKSKSMSKISILDVRGLRLVFFFLLKSYFYFKTNFNVFLNYLWVSFKNQKHGACPSGISVSFSFIFEV